VAAETLDLNLITQMRQYCTPSVTRSSGEAFCQMENAIQSHPFGPGFVQVLHWIAHLDPYQKKVTMGRGPLSSMRFFL